MRARILLMAVAAASAFAAATAAAHELDHAAPAYAPPAEPLSTAFNSGGDNAEWELIGTVPTGNPHSDLDFFTHKGETYASVGTLGTGPNGGGQTIMRLTEKGEVKPSFVASHPSAACPTINTSATALQHDVEATPKGTQLPNTPNPFQAGGDAQLLVDSTDGVGRCHDQGNFGQGAPQGGLEIIDITDPAKPKELALTSHIGNAHTVNVDPKRPHIAFDVTQDGVAVNAEGQRANETAGNQLDGFEIVDMSSCMNFPAGTSIDAKRQACRPQVYRYRYPQVAVSKSHTFNSMQSCHEVEIYPDDTLTCASITATALFDLSGAFDDNGTPNDYTDDKPRGTPLPCKVRESSTTAAAFKTAAPITDCAAGLSVSDWLKAGAPALEGVKWLGTVPHMGFGAPADLVNTPYDSTRDLVAAHESELTESGKFVITSDERGGGVVPGGATCSPGADNVRGNGGLHFFPRSSFTTNPPKTADESHKLWARTPDGKQAVWRAPIRTEPKGTFCTAHVFQIIPGQNRIFMGWYSQGTQVLDFVERPDGTVEFKQAGYFVPENANTWTSAIFRVEKNADGTFTYYGAASDGILPGAGRGAMDVYKVTLPAPPTPAGGPKPGTPSYSPPRGGVAQEEPPCAQEAAFIRVGIRPKGAGLTYSFRRRGKGRVRVDLFQQSVGRRIVGERRIARLTPRTRLPRLRDGVYFARFTTAAPNGSRDVRRVPLERTRGRFRVLPPFDYRRPCALVSAFKLERPVFGGSLRNSPLNASFRLGEPARVRIEVRRGKRLVLRRKARMYSAGRTHRVRLAFRSRAGVHTVRLIAERPGKAARVKLTSKRL